MNSHRCKVIQILDGDTFRVARKIGSFNKIRLARVKAPKGQSKMGRTATNTLRGLIGGKTVTIRTVGTSYDRWVAEVSYNWQNINNIMRAKGFR